MKLTVLVENTSCREDLTAEHGLSLLLETGGRRILFDAGQTGAFADNAAKLGVALQSVDLCVLSHGHYDHGGGLLRFLQLNDHAPVYVSEHAFGKHYNGASKYIGLAEELRNHPRLHMVSGDADLGGGLTLHSAAGRQPAFTPRPYGLTRRTMGVMQPEDFRHEQYLLVQEGNRRILVSGCSHMGVLNVMHWFQPDVLIGGFHLMKLGNSPEDQQTLMQVADALDASHCTFLSGHCTGDMAFGSLQQRLGSRLGALSTGVQLCL
jgi:7,8-dihydropterin-6-yl-methyl-4-(beta-D-ribofuranosyl)aminobenzene 5'-phosphate synthase